MEETKGSELYLIESHQFFTVHLLRLVQRDEVDLLWRESLIGEWSLDGVQIVRSNGHQRPLAGKILVQLVLKSDE